MLFLDVFPSSFCLLLLDLFLQDWDEEVPKAAPADCAARADRVAVATTISSASDSARIRLAKETSRIEMEE